MVWAICLIWALIDDGTKTGNVLRNIGGNKYEDLGRLQKLKESGAITEVEYEIENTKYKIEHLHLPKRQ